MRSKWWGIFLGSLVILLIVYIGFGTDLLSQSEEIGTIYLPRTANEKDAQRNGVILSKEYSFKFNRTNLLPRTSNADRILSVINKVYDNILRVNGEPLTVVNGDAAARSEEAYGNKACGVKEIIRSRRYLVGWNSPSSTVDIKASLLSSKSNDFVLSKFKANDSFADDMMHKLEEDITDIHVCSSKFSRETRIYNLPVDFRFNSCGEIARFFPDYLIDPNVYNVTFEKGYESTWWVLKHNGASSLHTSNGIVLEFDFESTFTYQYSARLGLTAQKIYEGEDILPTTNSEYSIRILSSNHGKGSWPKDLVDYFNTKFHELIFALGEDVAEKECLEN